MQIVLQIKRLLQAHGAWKQGIINELADFIPIHRHQITKLLNNELKQIPLDTLSAVCRFLVDRLGIAPEDVAQQLVRFEAEGLWSMLTYTHIDYCLGLRTVSGTSEPRWANAYDAMLQGAFLEEMFAAGHSGPKQHGGLKQHLVRSHHPACNQARLAEQSMALCAELRERKGSRGLVCLGSIKSNPLSECVVASAFGAKPFTAPQHVDKPQHRACPFFFRYRDDDPQPVSCYAGRQLARYFSDSGPGIYYETETGDWALCPTDDLHDAALVFYVHKPTERSVEMVLAGFSGIATGCIARDISRLSKRLWPPSLSRQDLKVGAFVIRYEFRKPPAVHVDFRHLLPKPRRTEVIPIAANVLARRILGEVGPPPEEAQEPELEQPVRPR